MCIVSMSFANVIALLTTRGLTSSVPLVAVVAVAVAILVIPTIVAPGSFPLIVARTVFIKRLCRSPILVIRAPSWFVVVIASITEPAVTWRWWWSSWLWGSAILAHFPLAIVESLLADDSLKPCCDEPFRSSAPCPWSVAGVET
jgi:hypothetical protein